MIKVKRIAALVLCLAVFCSLCGMLAGCSADGTIIKEMQRQIEEFKKQQTVQQETIDQQQTAIDELEKEKESLASTISELQKENEKLANLVDELDRNLYFAVENKDLVTVDERSGATSSGIGPVMWLTSLDKNLTVEWTCYKGRELLSVGHAKNKTLIIDGEKDVYFQAYYAWEDDVSLVVRDGDYIVGYAVLHIISDEYMPYYSSQTEVIVSYEFPKINSQYQNIPEAYVRRQISKYVTAKEASTNE